MQTTELWVPPAADADAACWYFIDNNRAYRGPVSKETLRYLYSTKAITGKTYVFAENLGAIESICTCPSVMTHANMLTEDRLKVGITDGFVRISCGIEDADDLIASLKQSLDAL